METIIVTDNEKSWSFLSQLATIVNSKYYLSNETYHQSKSLRVINLCHSYLHQTLGYYVSLLAQARDHKVIPSVESIQDVLSSSLSKFISQDVDDEIQSS